MCRHADSRTRVALAALLACLAAATAARAARDYVVTIPTSLADTTETFWLQIPTAYDPARPCPLLVGWHQYGSDHMEMKNASQFDSIADARGWIAACHDGPSPTHWTNHAAQSHVVDVIRWIEGQYRVDPNRIYMVGGSMGGAAGMVFSDNHLDPAAPRVAAAASLSGIQDCARRFHEQGWNNSMVGAFGGTPEKVPFTYHRNSAICFADSTQSMHFNARHLPLFLTFGSGVSDSIWRSHAEDLYAVMAGWADNVVLHESGLPGHGWGCAEEGLICDFLGGFALAGPPRTLSINADEEGVWGWAELTMREPDSSFARLELSAEPAAARLRCFMVRNVAAATLDLPAVGFPVAPQVIACRWAVRDAGSAALTLRGVAACPAEVTRDGAIYDDWTYDPTAQQLTLHGEGDGEYAIHSSPASVAEAGEAGAPRLVWDPVAGEIVCRLGAVGGSRCVMRDAGGRTVWIGVGVAGGDRVARLAVPRALPSGVYFGSVAGGPAQRLIVVR
jgi:poly(3-hydroxybutyrate) depolymerase